MTDQPTVPQSVADGIVLPKRLMLLVALLQGVALFGLYKTVDLSLWPSQSPVWFVPLWTFAIAWPLTLLLTLGEGDLKRLLIASSAGVLLLCLLGAYVGWQAQPFGEFEAESLLFLYGWSASLALFKGVMHLQVWLKGGGKSYSDLFRFSWQNSLVGALAFAFVLAIALLLWLWAALFAAIDVDFFKELFREDWFLFPVLSMAFGTAVILFRQLTHVIASITRLLQSLILFLLPLVTLVSISFLATLPFVGLDTLWDTGKGTALLLWQLALTLFFVNAVYQDGRLANPYGLFWHRFIYLGLLILPLVSALGCYGLALRVSQYGWSVDRLWAALIWLLLSLLAVSYAVYVLRCRDTWTIGLARANNIMSVVVMAAMLLANSPLLDFRKIAANSQWARVAEDSNREESNWIESFDFYYADQHLGRAGYQIYQRALGEIGDDKEKAERLEEARQPYWRRPSRDSDEFWHHVRFFPESAQFGVSALPEEVSTMMFETYRDPYPNTDNRILVFAEDLDSDGLQEYLVLKTYGSPAWDLRGSYYRLADGAWLAGELNVSNLTETDVDIDSLMQALQDSPPERKAPRYQDIKLGNLLLEPKQPAP